MSKNSEDISLLAAAMCKVQAEVENVVKESDNPFFRTKYADLGSILSHCRPILSKHGVSVIQFPVNDGPNVGVQTTVLHESGQSLTDCVYVPMPVDAKNVAQAVGSIITYLRRYAYASVVGVAQVDDDAQSVTSAAAKPVAVTVEMVTSSQLERISILMNDVRVADKVDAAMKKKGKPIERLTKEEASGLIKWANSLITGDQKDVI